jgi:AraC-like DNA-binding protein
VYLITSITLDCGFYDHSFFTRNFRKTTGVSPKEYRRQYRG